MKTTLRWLSPLITIAAIVLLITPWAGGQVNVSVKNGFVPCQGVNCDNVLEINGSADVQTGANVDFETGSELRLAGTAVTATAAELNALASAGLSAAEAAVLGGVTASAAELNLIDGSVAGTSVASKALALGANKETDVLALPVSGLKIGAGAGTAMDRTAAELNALAQGVAAGYKIARGDATLDGGNPTSAATGLATIVACTASYKGTSAPGLDPTALSVNPNGTSLDIYAWKPTAQGDTTLVASTNNAAVVSWICVGT